MVHGIVIPTSDAEDMRAIELAEVEDYQKAVGGWIEALDILSFGCTMYLNEEGLIRGLPYNRRATYLWWYHVPHARGQARLAGDAVLVGLPDRSGRSTDTPSAVRELLLGSTLCQVELQRLDSAEWRAAPSEPQTYIEAVVGATLMMEYALERTLRVVPLP
ncbi:hypothetical protein QE430_003319 [Microbacterium testaceum]|uniref:DUF3846 domain-containing protein n=1 Tax=Microbacterium testaceum TaxID=2033 RepID=UPI00278321A7|nr:DUF3846 domain-containing protein [Microbacterium testaceum]MDQ1175012.1 hypothetical protein [Microbacterium testaceum]